MPPRPAHDRKRPGILKSLSVERSSAAALLPSEQRLKAGWLRKRQGVFYSQTLLPSLNHLIRPRQHVRRNREADLLGGFKVDNEFKLHWPLHGKVGGLSPFQDLVYIGSSSAKIIGDVWRIRH